MKKNIFRIIACICLISLVWSCSTENDVQMQPDGNSQVQLKNSTIWEGELGIELSDGTYSITADKAVLTREIERISAEEGDVVKINSLEIVKVIATNDSNMQGVVLFAGTGNTGTIAKTMGFQLAVQSGSVSLANLANESGGDGPGHISCRGCGQGCFLEYYKFDGHLVGHCVPAGCGADCEKLKR